ncbi:hypothetical protein LINPERPRIM_LOCUS38296 [Linum perenne]
MPITAEASPSPGSVLTPYFRH